MSSNADSPIVLIAYPKAFGQRKFFEEKVTRLLSNFASYDVVALADSRGFVRDVCRDRVIVSCDAFPARDRDVAQIVSEISHAIVFWDGSDLTSFVFETLHQDKPLRVIPVKTTKVANRDKGQPFDVYIGRGTPWGNPFAIGHEGLTREGAIEKFREYFQADLIQDPNKRRSLLSLRGKILGCHCKPSACHGDIIAEYLNTLELDALPEEGRSEERTVAE